MLTLTTLEAINVSRDSKPAIAGRRYITHENGRNYLCTYSHAGSDGAPTTFTSQPFVVVNVWGKDD